MPREIAAPSQWRWDSRAALLVSMIVLTWAGLLLYVGPAWPMVLWRTLSDGAVACIWLAGAAGVGLFILRRAGICDEEVPGVLCAATAVAGGLGVFSLATLGLGLSGALNVVTAWGLPAVGWALGAVALRQMRHAASSRSFRQWLQAPAGWAWGWLLAAPFLALALTTAMTPPGMLWTPQEPHGYDVVEYHLQAPREWFEARRIHPLRHNVFSFFPFNVEMHFLLAMHLRGGAWAGMYLAQLMHLAFMAMTVVSAYGFARRFTTPASAIIAAVSLLTVPWLTQLAGIAYDEGGFLLFGTQAIGWGLLATFRPGGRVRRFALAGAMAGFAAGSKLTAVPEVLVALPFLAAVAGLWMQLRRRPEARGVWLGVATCGVAGILCFSPWLIRNLAWAGNPVFPEMMPLLGRAYFSPGQVERFELAHKPPPAQRPLAARLNTLNREVLGWTANLGDSSQNTSAWQFGYLLLPLGLIAFALSVRRPESWFLLGLLLILTVFWLAMTHLQSRFFILAAPICALLLAQIDWRRAAPAAAALVCAFAMLSWWNIHQRLSAKLYGSDSGSAGVVSVLGADGAWLYSQMLPAELPDSGTIDLVGDARAFLYPIPMSRLRYRTVFDVPDNAPDIVQAWIGKGPGAEWRLIDPAELRRFRQTYFGLPPIPPDVEQAPAPYLTRRPPAN